MSLPPDVARLLWDVDPSTIDLTRASDRDFVMERVMSRGSLAAMRWLRASFTMEDLADFVRNKGAARLSPRDLAYWALVAGVRLVATQGGGRPAWAGP